MVLPQVALGFSVTSKGVSIVLNVKPEMVFEQLLFADGLEGPPVRFRRRKAELRTKKECEKRKSTILSRYPSDPLGTRRSSTYQDNDVTEYPCAIVKRDAGYFPAKTPQSALAMPPPPATGTHVPDGV